eukprot:c20843_g1_i1.p1 GENE.c20843_g1_i1~~c20843_g1_i1.p1  ORF type:complete len:1114 (+),score=510.20 c20843_g1_i1:83-3343(+)
MSDLTGLLVQLLSANNEERAAAESIFNQAKNSPQELVFGLLKCLVESPRSDLKLMSSILLRQVLVRDEKSLWDNLQVDAKQEVKRVLLSVLASFVEKNIQRKICDIIAELTAKQDEDKNSILVQMVEWSKSDNQNLRLSSVLVLSQMCKEHGEAIQNQAEWLLHAFEQNISHKQPELIPLRLAALDLFTNIPTIISKEQRPKWQNFLPLVIQMMSDMFHGNFQNECRQTLQILLSIVEEDSKGLLLKPYLGQFVEAMAVIASQQNVDEGIRRLAVEFLLTVSANCPVFCRKLTNFTETLFQIAFQFMLDLDDDLEEWNNEDPNDEDTMTEAYIFGEEAMDRMAVALRWKALKSSCTKLISQHLQNPDWKYRHSALMTISQVGEVIPVEEINPVVGILLRCCADPHPRVRWAALHCIGQLSSDFGPHLQETFHGQVFPVLITCMNDPSNPRVQAHAASATINFVEHLETEQLVLYLEPVLNSLQGLIVSQNRFVKEQALPTLATVADIAEKEFSPYYATFMPQLRMILFNAHQSNNQIMRAKAIECISLIGVSVGSELFMNDAREVIQIMFQAQTQQTTVPGDENHSYMLSAWTRMCKCLKQDFIPYLNTAVPPLLETLKLDEVVTADYDSDSDEPDQTNVNTGLLDDISTAVNMLFVYAVELEGGFMPWVEPVTKELIRCLTFIFLEDVRSTAALCLPELLVCVKDFCKKQNTNEAETFALMKRYFDQMIEPLAAAITQEVIFVQLHSVNDDEDAMQSLLEGIASLIRVGDKGILTTPQTNQLFELFIFVLDYFDKKQLQRSQALNSDECDEELQEQLEDESDMDDMRLTELSSFFSSLLKCGDTNLAMNLFEEKLRDRMLKKLQDQESPNNIRFALCIFDDVLEHGNGALLPYFNQLVEVLIGYCSHDIPDVRQPAAFGLGICALNATTQFLPFLERAVIVLTNIVQNNQARTPENEPATDNAVSSLGKIMIKYPQTTSSLCGFFIDYLPIQQDTVEANISHFNLLDLLTRDFNTIAGPSFVRLPKILSVCSVMIDEKDALKPEQIQKLKEVLIGLSNNYRSVCEQAFARIAPKERENIVKFVQA